MNISRTLIIGLDGATFDLIEPLIQAGQLPVLARLMEQGVHGPLCAWPDMNSAAAWSSIITGYNSGQHGVYHFLTLDTTGYKWHPTTAADRKKDPFWRLLSAAGQYVGVINVPISYPADPVNGFMLTGMDTPSTISSGIAYPLGLLDELRHQGIDYIIDAPNLGALSRQDPYRVPEVVERMIDARSRTILYLMRTRPWDVLMAVFVATDRMQHYFWPSPHTRVEDPEWAPMRSIYRQIDSFFGKALELIDERTTVLVISDHGFGPTRYAMQSLNQLFAQLGLLRYRQGEGRLKSSLLKYLLLTGRKIIPLSLQAPLARTFPRLHFRAVIEHMLSGVEWAHTKVVASPDGQMVFINLKGREPEGIVPPEEYDPLREQVRDVLLRLTDPASGRCVIQAVHRREEIYHGPYLGQAPDLVIDWDYESVGDSLYYPDERGPIIVRLPKRGGYGEGWTGMHRPEGIFIAYGPHIKQGATVANATIHDITPTILYLQGHPIPRDMDGRVLTDIFTEEQLRRHPVRQGEPASVGVQTAAAYLDPEEAREIEERLRSLGYIE